MFRFILSAFILFSVPFSVYAQNAAGEPTLRQQRVQEEITSSNLPALPEGRETAKKNEVPQGLNIASDEVVKTRKAVPNDGKAFFTVSGGLAPFQVSLGVLKYFIAEWWGQADLGVYFFPKIAYENYFIAVKHNDFSPYIGFKVSSGYSFYNARDFEASIFVTMQFAFISTVDIPIIFGGAFRFIYRIFWVDLGVLYSYTAGGAQSPIFNGVQPYFTLGFRF